jgi:hypothetical protein
MKLLLTSAGVKNASIRDALVDLLGKPISESNALCIPTAQYGSMYEPRMSCAGAWRFITGREPRTPMCELGWKSMGVLELTALPSIDEERWVRRTRSTTRPRSEWSTASSRSSPKGTGGCSAPARPASERARRQRALGCPSAQK